MQILLACAKTMNDAARAAAPFSSVPKFQDEARHFALDMCGLSQEEISRLLHCNARIAAQNKARYMSFFNEEELLPAVLAYYGQAYKYLRADSFTQGDFLFAQNHLWIASFLYGLLRPLDAIHPYRMEGKVRLPWAQGKNLFGFWKPRLTDFLIDAVQADDGILLHLATEEFQHLFDWKRVEESVRVVQPQFMVRKTDGLKTVVVYAKTCRGAMARYAITRRLEKPETLREFQFEGFEYRGEYGDADKPYFVIG